MPELPPPLDLSDDEPTDPEELAFLEDLKAYDNPEIYGDPNQSQVFKYRIVNYLLPNNPSIIRAEIDGDLLPDALVEGMFGLMSVDPPELAKMLAKTGDASFEEFRSGLELDEPEKFKELQDIQYKFFIRYFPRLLLHLYGLGVTTAFAAALLTLWRNEPDEELNTIEIEARKLLESQIKNFERTIKSIVGTRSSGRPKKILSTRGLPEIVNQVINTARSMMGDRRGEDAVPGLKEIAVALNFSSPEALGKQLKRAYYPWLLSIKPFLSALPPPDKNPT